jgi:hypothetical protein
MSSSPLTPVSSPEESGPSAKAIGKRRAASPSPSQGSTKRPRPNTRDEVETLILNGDHEEEEEEEEDVSIRLLDQQPQRQGNDRGAPPQRDDDALGPLPTRANIVLDTEPTTISPDVATTRTAASPTRHPKSRRRLSLSEPAVPSAPLSSASSSAAKGKQKERAADSEPAADPDPVKPFSAVSCPVCLGAPSPLAVTRCGHVLFVVFSEGSFCCSSAYLTLFVSEQLWWMLAYIVSFSPPVANTQSLCKLTKKPPLSSLLSQVNPAAGWDDTEGRCPVCRTELRGGWGKSMRGLVLRMGVVEP